MSTNCSSYTLTYSRKGPQLFFLKEQQATIKPTFYTKQKKVDQSPKQRSQDEVEIKNNSMLDS